MGGTGITGLLHRVQLVFPMGDAAHPGAIFGVVVAYQFNLAGSRSACGILCALIHLELV